MRITTCNVLVLALLTLLVLPVVTLAQPSTPPWQFHLVLPTDEPSVSMTHEGAGADVHVDNTMEIFEDEFTTHRARTTLTMSGGTVTHTMYSFQETNYWDYNSECESTIYFELDWLIHGHSGAEAHWWVEMDFVN